MQQTINLMHNIDPKLLDALSAKGIPEQKTIGTDSGQIQYYVYENN